ncbi:5-Hydroxyisourate Hydrolase (HIUase) [Euzebya pacifica]|uniref:5-hydroxyisourate hydrolase n=1 Tax=Euzebya pacifica TaxID=1608957 RepID=A0A346Y1E6_9ACTN|nr:hydroxyisourate hydrolase [Euzebya pacifica]AXV08293.1 5-Hydroxyisourate Hydrolase (HIUase) [Euzebya pacifica]
MSLSTHVLDTANGAPAAGVSVVAERAHDDGWVLVGRGTTDADGRVPELADGLVAGTHRLTFEVGRWFAEADTPTFWSDVVIAFVVADPDEHHHVPLLLSPYGYSTYRGS